MPARRRLIVNADDFGQSHGVNRGIMDCFERGILTSASLMVRSPAAAEAARYAVEHPQLSIGLHLDLGEWAFESGQWVPSYGVVPLDDADAVSAEVARQLSTFNRLLGTPPSHIDSHQHVHRSEPVRSIVRQLAQSLGVPLRHETRDVRYCGDFYGQTDAGEPLPDRIGTNALLTILQALPPGCTELACHPSAHDDLTTMYARERLWERETLCSVEVGQFVQRRQIELCSFHTFRDGRALRAGSGILNLERGQRSSSKGDVHS